MFNVYIFILFANTPDILFIEIKLNRIFFNSDKYIDAKIE